MPHTVGTGYTNRTDKYRPEDVIFETVIPDHIKTGTPAQAQEYMLAQAAQALATELIKMHDVFDIETTYDILTLSTRIRHRLRVLVKEK